MTFQTITLVGNLGKDPVSRITEGGTQMTTFSLAANSGWGDYEQRLWFNVTAFGKKAELINTHFYKGKPILVTGYLTGSDDGNPRTYERGDGSVGASFDVKLEDFKFLPKDGGAPTQDVDAGGNIADDDLLF